MCADFQSQTVIRKLKADNGVLTAEQFSLNEISRAN